MYCHSGSVALARLGLGLGLALGAQGYDFLHGPKDPLYRQCSHVICVRRVAHV